LGQFHDEGVWWSQKPLMIHGHRFLACIKTLIYPSV
jgi:hypothetical protein